MKWVKKNERSERSEDDKKQLAEKEVARLQAQNPTGIIGLTLVQSGGHVSYRAQYGLRRYVVQPGPRPALANPRSPRTQVHRLLARHVRRRRHGHRGLRDRPRPV